MSEKKIGILTFHTSINNGAVVQCYSLAKKLKNEFPDVLVEIIDYRMPKIENLYDVSIFRYLKNGPVLQRVKRFGEALYHINQSIWLKERTSAFKSVRHVLPLSEETIFSDDPQALFSYINKNYDVVIAGSDAIWNYSVRGFPNPYFLDSSLNCKMLSYAASCYGMSYELIPREQRDIIGRILRHYCFLGVRDNESANFASEMDSTLKTVHTCDPTVFLDVEDLPIDKTVLQEKLAKRGFRFDREAICVMGNDQLCDMAKTLYGDRYQIVALYNYCQNADINLHDLTPYEWAYVFRYFKLTFTTFFHGTLLSLRNGIPVICIQRETEYAEKHMTKVEDFLHRVGLESCIFSTDYKNKNIDAIKKKADEHLEKDTKAEILAKMNEEAKSIGPFMEALCIALSEENKETDK